MQRIKILKLTISIAAVLGVGLFLSVRQAQGESIYVDQEIDDCNTYDIATRKCSANNLKAKSTIQAAMNNATAGDTIYVRAGIYYENIILQTTGTSNSARITLTNYNSEGVVIDGSKEFTGSWIQCNGSYSPECVLPGINQYITSDKAVYYHDSPKIGGVDEQIGALFETGDEYKLIEIFRDMRLQIASSQEGVCNAGDCNLDQLGNPYNCTGCKKNILNELQRSNNESYPTDGGRGYYWAVFAKVFHDKITTPTALGKVFIGYGNDTDPNTKTYRYSPWSKPSVINTNDKDFITIKGFTFRGARYPITITENSEGIRVSYNKIYKGTVGINADGCVYGFEVDHNEFLNKIDCTLPDRTHDGITGKACESSTDPIFGHMSCSAYDGTNEILNSESEKCRRNYGAYHWNHENLGGGIDNVAYITQGFSHLASGTVLIHDNKFDNFYIVYNHGARANLKFYNNNITNHQVGLVPDFGILNVSSNTVDIYNNKFISVDKAIRFMEWNENYNFHPKINIYNNLMWNNNLVPQHNDGGSFIYFHNNRDTYRNVQPVNDVNIVHNTIIGGNLRRSDVNKRSEHDQSRTYLRNNIFANNKMGALHYWNSGGNFAKCDHNYFSIFQMTTSGYGPDALFWALNGGCFNRKSVPNNEVFDFGTNIVYGCLGHCSGNSTIECALDSACSNHGGTCLFTDGCVSNIPNSLWDESIEPADFRLSAGWPPVNAGTKLTSPSGITTDYYGEVRPNATTAWDMGAVEYGAAASAREDVNRDGSVNIKDIQACIKAITGSDDTYKDNCMKVVPPETTANIKDIQEIIRKIITPN